MTEREVAESLVAYGAPLAGWDARAHATLERTLVEALRLAHENPTLLRVLRVVVCVQAEHLDWSALLTEATREQLRDELAMVVDLTADLTKDVKLARILAAWNVPSPPVPRAFFPR